MSGPRVRPSASESDRDEDRAFERTPPPRRETRSERSHPRHDRDSKKKDKSKVVNPTARCWQRMLLALLFVCTTAGTVVSFWLLPKGAGSADSIQPAHAGMATPAVALVRMVHLSLSNSDRRARFVLDENTVWEAFLAGCRERLQVAHILKVTDSSGETILAVEVRAHMLLVGHSSRRAEASIEHLRRKSCEKLLSTPSTPTPTPSPTHMHTCTSPNHMTHRFIDAYTTDSSTHRPTGYSTHARIHPNTTPKVQPLRMAMPASPPPQHHPSISTPSATHIHTHAHTMSPPYPYHYATTTTPLLTHQPPIPTPCVHPTYPKSHPKSHSILTVLTLPPRPPPSPPNRTIPSPVSIPNPHSAFNLHLTSCPTLRGGFTSTPGEGFPACSSAQV